MTVTPYNFQKPGPLASALEHQFAGWLKTACALATRKWRKEMPAGFEILVGASEFERARDTFGGLNEGSFGYRIALHERLTTMVVWPRPLLLGLIAALQGGTSQELPGDRELTLVEESLFEFFLKDLLLPSFVETWSGRLPIRPVLGPKEGNPRWSRLFAADEGLVVTRFTLRGPFGDQAWLWLVPKKGLLESLWQETESAENAAALKQRLEGLVRDLPVEVRVTLGRVELNLSELSELRVGDVLVLDQRIHHPLKAQVGGEEKLCGWPGRLGNRQVLRIEDWER